MPNRVYSLFCALQVKVGVGNLSFELGSLKYTNQKTWIGIPLIICLIGGPVLIAVIILIVCLVRKNTAKENEYKGLLMQFDELERNVRDQCKQGTDQI